MDILIKLLLIVFTAINIITIYSNYSVINDRKEFLGALTKLAQESKEETERLRSILQNKTNDRP